MAKQLSILTLPVLTTLLVAILTDSSLTLSLWDSSIWDWPGWAALEACGTLLAVVVALGIALWAATTDRRREAQQRRRLRLLLRREIQANQHQLFAHIHWATDVKRALDTDTDSPLPDRITMTVRNSVKRMLEEHLQLYSVSFDEDEMAQTDTYYHDLKRCKTFAEAIDFEKIGLYNIKVNRPADVITAELSELDALLNDAYANGESLLTLIKRK
jgi:hypothetical protein